MLRKLRLLITFILASFTLAFSQTGKLSGRVSDAESGETIPYANVVVKKEGLQKGGTTTDFDGNYSVSPLVPGSYEVEVSYVGYAPYKITGVIINFEKTTRLDIKLLSESKVLEQDVIIYAQPLIDPDETSTGAVLTSKDIEKIGTRSVSSLATTQPGITSSDDGGTINMRGARDDATQYFINGVKLLPGQQPNVPVEAISEIAILTGGIPAQYGDNVGGVISLTTKGPSSRIFGGIAGETSMPFDNYNYNLANLNISGPLLQQKDSLGNPKLTKVGYFLAAQFDGARDPSPPGIDVYRLNDETQRAIEQNPLFVDDFGNIRYVSDTLRASQVEAFDFEAEENRFNVNLNGSLDFQPNENILITVGGNYRLSDSKDYNRITDPERYKRLMNTANNGDRTIEQYNVFARFTQRFKGSNEETENPSAIKDAYYQVQLDYSRNRDETSNKDFGTNFFEYAYVGKFERETDTLNLNFSQAFGGFFPGIGIPGVNDFNAVDSTGRFQDDLIWQFGEDDTDTILVKAGTPFHVINTNIDTYNFTPGSQNPVTARYTDFFFDIRELSNQPIQDLQNLNSSEGGLLNGQAPNTVHGGLFANVGTPHRSYNLSLDQQIRLSVLGVVNLNNHSLKLGAEYEQRWQRQFNVGTQNVWNAARAAALSGTSLQGAGFNDVPEILYVANPDPSAAGDSIFQINSGQWGDKVLVDNVEQFQIGVRNAYNPEGTFHNNIRNKFGYAPDYRINVDELNPQDLSLSDFSAEELLNFTGTSAVSYQGYTYDGKFSRDNASFSDFFSDPQNRPIASWNPIYFAFFIEDKFEIRDLILRLGLRVDQYDVNQPVLKDRHSLVDLQNVGETNIGSFNGGDFNLPGNVGDEWVIYVDRNPEEYNGNNIGEFNVVGFRDDNVWFTSDGVTARGASNLSNGDIFPWFDATQFSGEKKAIFDQYKITEDAFEDYKPQTNVMPRVSFSFPISEEALFFAHYDVLTQRPSRNNVITSTYFYFNERNGGTLNNPNLLPQRNIDYQVGFQQVLSKSSSLKMSTFYREMKDQISLIVVEGAYPVASWQSFGNIDFATSKGITFEYDLRRTNRLRVNANYQLAFADGTSSGETSNQRLIQSGVGANLRAPIPLNWDERHQIKVNVDYRFRDNDGPAMFGKPIKDDEGNFITDDNGVMKKSGGFRLFENLGVNFQLIASSGRPFTPRGGANPFAISSPNTEPVDGSVNGARLPWNLRSSVRLDKTLMFGSGEKRKSSLNVYVYVQNLLGLENIQSVYGWTGSAYNDGFLESKLGQQTVRQSPYSESYADIYGFAVRNPGNFSLPRRIRIGAAYNF